MRRMKKLLTVAWLCLMIAALLPLQTLAVEPIDLWQDVTLTIHYFQDSIALKGARFDIYRVADTTEFAVFSACGDFSDYVGDVNELGNADKWNALAQNLCAYADVHQISPMKSGVIDDKGKSTFESLTPGLYLVVGHGIKVSDVTYTCQPFVICLPYHDVNDDVWDYSVDTSPKAGTPIRKPPPPNIPQTGMLWWPVPVMLCLGTMFLAVGAVGRRRDPQ